MSLDAGKIAEISNQRNTTQTTLRITSSGIESLLYTVNPVLDHGFVRVVDYMGNDSSIVQAARVSYGTGTRKTRGDEALIRFLMRHKHTTPFEMCEIKLHVKLPIFVARQWVRHRTASVNEYSARYSKLDNEFYIPETDNLSVQATGNRQGRGDVLEGKEAENVLKILKEDSALAYDHYEQMLSTEGQLGLARELARMNLPSNVYTQWYWKTNLHNLLHFIALRADSHAQFEIREFAHAISKIVNAWVPVVWQAYEDYIQGAVTLSAQEVELIKKMLSGEKIAFTNSGLSKREWSDFKNNFNIE